MLPVLRDMSRAGRTGGECSPPLFLPFCPAMKKKPSKRFDFFGGVVSPPDANKCDLDPFSFVCWQIRKPFTRERVRPSQLGDGGRGLASDASRPPSHLLPLSSVGSALGRSLLGGLVSRV